MPSCATLFHLANVIPIVWALIFYTWIRGPGLAGLLDTLGLVCGKCGRIDLGLLAVTLARESVFLRGAESSYATSAVPAHRLQGWWSLVQMGLHSLAYIGYYAHAHGLGLPFAR